MIESEKYIESGTHSEIEDVMTKELVGLYQKWKDYNKLPDSEDEKMKAFFLLIKGEIGENEGNENDERNVNDKWVSDEIVEKELKEKVKILFDIWKKYTGIEVDDITEKPEIIFLANAEALLDMELKKNRRKIKIQKQNNRETERTKNRETERTKNRETERTKNRETERTKK